MGMKNGNNIAGVTIALLLIIVPVLVMLYSKSSMRDWANAPVAPPHYKPDYSKVVGMHEDEALRYIAGLPQGHHEDNNSPPHSSTFAKGDLRVMMAIVNDKVIGVKVTYEDDPGVRSITGDMDWETPAKTWKDPAK